VSGMGLPTWPSRTPCPDSRTRQARN
jgi:hypothetical protein